MQNPNLLVTLRTKKYQSDMAQLLVTVNDNAQLPHLRTAIRQLKGVEQVAMLRKMDVAQKALMQGKVHRELLERADSLGRLAEGWDGSGSKAIAPQSIRKFKTALGRVEEKLLQGWALFPDAHGYLYLDYTGSNAVAGITMTGDRLIYFFKKDGKVVKNDGAAFTTRNLLSILQRVHG